MKIVMACFVGWLLSVGVEAESVVEGQVRLAAGETAAGAQVRLFDLGNLRRGAVAQATTDAAGAFVLSLGVRPAGFVLGQNYPNPFNPSTIIPYELAAAARVRLEVFNTLGQRMATLVNEAQPAGAHRAQWNGTDASGRAVAAGVYLYRLTAASTSSAYGTSQTGRMVLVDGQAGFDKTSTSSVESLSPRGDASSLRAELVEARPVEGVASSYGLVVSGVGLETYVDAEFRIEAAMEPVVVEAHRVGRGKVAQTLIGILGDVDNTGEVTLADALLVTAYSLDSSIAMPNNGAIWLGDVNADGRVDGADAQLIERYSRNRASSLGIGRPLMLRPVSERVVGRLGDVDNNRRVNLADALLVTAYSLDPSIEMPDGGTIWLGDINGDSRIDGADAQLIEQYSRNPNASELPDGMGELVTIRPIIGPLEPPIVEPPVEPPVAGLLTIPPLTLTVGSSYTHHIIKGFGVRELNPFFAPAYSVALQGDDVVERKSIVRGGILGDQQINGVIDVFVTGGGGLAELSKRYKSVTITGISPGTAEVAIAESDFGDAQTIAVTVVPRPTSILEMTLEQEEQEAEEWIIGGQSHQSHVAASIYTDADNQASYAVYELSMADYLALSRLSAEVGIVLEEAWDNVKSDVMLAVLGLVPGLGIPTTILSLVGDARMYVSIIDIVRAVEKKSTKVRLQGLFAHDGSIIPGNRYLQLLMAKDKDDKDEVDGDFAVDLKLRVQKKIRIDSESVSIHPIETIDYGSFNVREWTGVQIIPLRFVTFDEEEGRALDEVGMWLAATHLHNQVATYKVRKKGPALTVRSWVDHPSNSGDLFNPPFNPTGNFTLSTVVSNWSERFASDSVTLSYYCSQDATIDPSDKRLADVSVAALASLASTEKEIVLPPPFVRSESSTQPTGPQSCLAELGNVVYYGACVPDETAGEGISACSAGVPVLAFR